MASDKALAIYSYSETVPLESRIDGFISLSVLQGHTSQATGEERLKVSLLRVRRECACVLGLRSNQDRKKETTH